MCPDCIEELKTWKIGSRVRVTDDLGLDEPLLATIVSIYEEFSWFELRYDHTGKVSRVGFPDICDFELVPAG